MELRQIVKKVLEELGKDKVIDCNQYQGEDFEELVRRVQNDERNEA